MPTPRMGHHFYDLGIKIVETKLADNDVVRVCAPVVAAGKVVEVWVGETVLPTTGTLAVAKSAATNVNLLTAATVNLASGVAAYVAASQTLAAGVQDLCVSAGDMLTAVWTLTNITTGGAVPNVFCCLVVVAPDVW